MIDKKTLIIWGKNDTMIPVANAYRGHKLIANSRLTVFDRCSHNPQYEKASEFNALVSEFLLDS
jgi:4,5:9,10-diseco-3-hydroxy-5,9,17-trioxoandrosta-1(10),2-diene-4-oate hydrolase